MNINRLSAFGLQPLVIAVISAPFLLATATLRVDAQDTVTISGAEFQRLVYSAHLHTMMAEKPELDASLQVLLGLHERNPYLPPASLASLLQTTTARYRTNAPSYIRTNGFRDEILAAYLDALRGVPKPAGFVPADLTMLKVLVTRAKNPGGQPEAGLIHSGSQAQLSGEYDAAERRALLDACTRRASASAGFADAMDRLLRSEIRCSVTSSAAEIIGSPDSPLHGNITMTTLLASNAASPNSCSLTICSNDVKKLFAAESQSLWAIVHTNLDLTLEFNWSQPDLTSYLTNQAAVTYWSNRMAEARQDTARQIACSSAAVLVQSQLTDAPGAGFAFPAWVGPVLNVEGGLATLCFSGDPGSLISSIPGVLGLFETAETPDEQIIREIGNIKTMIGDLSTNINYRFDRVDQSLTGIFNVLNEEMDKIQIIDEHTVHLSESVDSIRSDLVGIQNGLYRIERNLATFAADDWRANLVEQMNRGLGYEARVGGQMGYTNSDPSYDGMENVFYTHAHDRAIMETLSHYTTLPYGDEYFYSQLSPGGSTNVYGEVLNYIKKCLRVRLSLPGFPESPTLANPQDWNAGAGAWLQLALENPGYFRLYERDGGYPSRLEDIISKGRELTNFHRSLTFSGAVVNSNLYTELGNYYNDKLSEFNSLVATKEDEYTATTNFALNPWRPWDSAAPRVTTTNTALLLAKPGNLIAAGTAHSLAVKADGTVVGWGDSSSGKISIPAGLNSVVAVAAGWFHSAALQADGTVVCWGDNSYGETTIPADLTNAVAISLGALHGLALRADGTVASWGYNGGGQTSVPLGLNNVVAIAGGAVFSLALRADGTVVGWGWNAEGEATGVPNGPPGIVTLGGRPLTNVVAIGAGEYHSLALKGDGTVVGWGAGTFVASPDDGLNYGQAVIPAGLSNVVAIEAGAYHNLALKADGTVVGWGAGNSATAGHALSFDGVNDYVEFNRPVQDDFTIEFWFRSTQVAGGETQWYQGMGLVDGEVGGTHDDFGVSFGNGKVLFGTGNPDITIRSGAVLTDAKWHHVAATREKASGTITLFVDGVQNASLNTGSRSSLTSPAKLRLGSLQTALNYFQGQIDEVRIWNVVRSESQIRNNRNVSLTGTEPNLVMYYRLDEGSGSIASDATTNHIDGLVNGSAWVDSSMPNWGQATPPSGLGSVVGIAAGGGHSLAQKADGTIVGWGDNSADQATPRGWVASPRARNHIAAGCFHGLALKADGTVIGWGAGTPGSTGENDRGQATIPSDLTNVVAISAGGYSDDSLALKANGTVVAWGWNYYGQTNVPTGLAGVVAIAAGSFHGLALKADGTVVGWGYNNHGQINVPTGLANVVGISAGSMHSMAVKADGTVVAWGWNGAGQINVPAGLSDVMAVGAAELHSLALKADGTVVAWGYNGQGQTSVPTGLSTVVAIAVGNRHNLALKADGTVVAWGDNGDGEANVPLGLSNVVAIAAGSDFSLALKTDGTVVGWGAGGPGAGEFGQTIIPTNVIDLAAWRETATANWSVPPVSSPITAVTAGSAHSLALTADGSVTSWGLNTWGQTNVPPQARSGVQAVAAGLGHSLVLTNSGVFAWGLNDAGQATVPTSAQSGVVAISAGGKHNLALRHDGRVVAWGLGGSGQTNVPITLYNNQNSVVAIAAGGEHSLALDAYGTVWAWGGNTSGQGTVPGDVTNIVAIAAGRYHNLALTYDGRVRAWGLNSSGQCNVPAAAQSGVVAIAAGDNQSLAIKGDGTAVVWGSGPAPLIPLQSCSNVVGIAAGDRHSLILSAGGAPSYDSPRTFSFVRAQIPVRVVWLIRNANDYVVGELGRDVLHTAGTELSGAKALMQAALQLGMPYTLERDDVLRGFLYGSESLIDLDGCQTWLTNENARLQATPSSVPLSLSELAALRQQRFTEELNQCLGNLREPEIPRLVGHTLRLLNVLHDAWAATPPSALELGMETNGFSLVLYGEPYAHYTLQYRDDLSGPGWTPTGITALHSEQSITPPISSGQRRFYRAMLPQP